MGQASEAKDCCFDLFSFPGKAFLKGMHLRPVQCCQQEQMERRCQDLLNLFGTIDKTLLVVVTCASNTALHRLKEIHRPLHGQCRLNPNLFVTGSVAVLERFLCMGLVCISFTSLAGGWFLLENCASLTAVCV